MPVGPEQVGGRIMYPADPDYFGDYAQAFCEPEPVSSVLLWHNPEHISAMHKALVSNRQAVVRRFFIHLKQSKIRKSPKANRLRSWPKNWRREICHFRRKWTRRAVSPLISSLPGLPCYRKLVRMPSMWLIVPWRVCVCLPGGLRYHPASGGVETTCTSLHEDEICCGSRATAGCPCSRPAQYLCGHG